MNRSGMVQARLTGTRQANARLAEEKKAADPFRSPCGIGFHELILIIQLKGWKIKRLENKWCGRPAKTIRKRSLHAEYRRTAFRLGRRGRSSAGHLAFPGQRPALAPGHPARS